VESAESAEKAESAESEGSAELERGVRIGKLYDIKECRASERMDSSI
jgi:hypothetical protein